MITLYKYPYKIQTVPVLEVTIGSSVILPLNICMLKVTV